MAGLKLKVNKRTDLGTSNVRRLRRTGTVPAVVYGKKAQNTPLNVVCSDFLKVFKQAGESTIVELESSDEKWNVVIGDVQYHPVRSDVLHVDFRAVSMDEEIIVSIPVEFVGDAPAVKEEGGIVVENIDEIEIRCLPGDLIHNVTVDVSSLAHIGDALHVSDIVLPAKITMETDPETLLVNVAPPVSEAELEANVETIMPESETGAPKEGEEGAEGGEGAAVAGGDDKSKDKDKE